ncbi:MAG: sugar transferase [Nitrospirae bacterium]|nr:MAG: sugar transferase [Nitrospirota bacterium]
MMLILLFIEMCSIFTAIYATTIMWADLSAVSPIEMANWPAQALALSLCCGVTFYYNDLYDFRTVRSFPQFLSRLPGSFGAAVVLAGSLLYVLLPQAQFSAGPVVASFLTTAGLLLLIRAASYGVMKSRLFLDRVLILGATPLAQSLIAELEARQHCKVIGVVDDVLSSDPVVPRHLLLGSRRHLRHIIEEVRPSRIVAALTERRGRLPVNDLLESRVNGIVVEDGIEVYERLTGKLAIESLMPSNLIFSRDFRKFRLDLAFGRTISLLVSIIGLVLCAPLLGLIALAIKLDSTGPVFFVQERVGKGGRRFQLIKFRTMHLVSSHRSEWAKDNGDRITRVGRWLRKFRLDELPQFVNILRGDMNLVGPRPHPASNFELFVLVSRNASESGAPIPYYSFRSMVRPGITGWAQVRYRYANDLEEEIEKLCYDLYYIKYLSIWLDLRILFETVKIVFLGHEMREDGARTIAADTKAVNHQATSTDSVQADLPTPSRWQPSPQNRCAVETAWAETLPLTQAHGHGCRLDAAASKES